MLKGQKEARKKLSSRLDPTQKRIWIHAASLGEFEQARPLIERIRRDHPDRHILLSFFSPSGYEVRKDYPLADCVTYLPFDTPANARRFIRDVNPEMAIFVKYEFWGNYLKELKRRDVPTYIISAIFRPKQSFFRSWGGMMRKMLRCFTTIYVQDDASLKLLSGIGINNVVKAGDTRFDRVTDVMHATFSVPVVERFMAGVPVRLIVGSSWEADEDFYLPYLNAHPEIKAVIAPHEMHGNRVEALAARCQNGAVRLSELSDDSEAPDAQVIITDSFGKLSSLYRYGNLAYIGGGFGAGIHNINEAAVYSMPVIFGPRYDKFKEAHDLISRGGAFTYSKASDLALIFDKFLSDPGELKHAGETAGQYIKENLGATDRIAADLFTTKNQKKL